MAEWLSAILFLLLPSFKAGANDDFYNRAPLHGDLPLSVASSHADASSGGIHAGKPSRWWTWTATNSGWHQLQVDSETPVSISVYKGKKLYQLLTLAESTPSQNGDPATLPIHATKGESYEIAILGTTTSIPGPFTLGLSAISHPSPNDNFEDAIHLGEALDIAIHASNYGASSESEEPYHDSSIPRSSVWWTITPAISRRYEFWLPDPQSRHYEPRLSLYEGTHISNLKLVKKFYTYRASENLYSGQPFAMTAGRTYHLAMDRPAYLGATDGSLKLTIIAEPIVSEQPPANDNFADAHDLGESTDTSFVAHFAFATREAGEVVRPRRNNFIEPLQQTSWWKWKCPESGSYGLTPLGFQSSYDHLHILKENAEGALEDVFTREIQAEIIDAIAGETYFFMTGTLSRDKAEQIRFQLKKIDPSLNRSNVTATDLGSVHEFEVSGETFTNSGLPLAWKWSPSLGGNYRFLIDSTSGTSSASTSFAIYRLDANQEFEPILINHQGNFYPLKSNNTYFIYYSEGRRGFHTVNAIRLPDTVNDNFENSIDLGSTPYARSVSSTYGAGLEESEPTTSYTRSLWWKWQAPEDGVWQFITSSNSPVEIFQGSQINTLQRLGVGTLSVNPGETYFLRLTTFESREQTLIISKGLPTLNNFRSQPMDLGNSMYIEARGGYTQATADPDEPGTRNLWWTWSAPETGYYILQTQRSDEQNMIYADPQNLPFPEWTPIPVSFFKNRSNHSIFKATKGDRFLITSYIENFQPLGSGGGSSVLSISPFEPPEGDFFESPIDLGNASQLSYPGIGTNASFAHNDPQLCNYCHGSIWMTWEAPATGLYEIEGQSISSEYSEDGIAVYTGNDPTTLTTIAFAAEDDDKGESFTTFRATGGSVYRIVFFSEDAFDRFAVSITPVYSYEHWIEGWQDYLAYWRRSPLSDEEARREGNPNQDGISNFTKYVFGLNPTIHQGSEFNLRNLPTLSTSSNFLELKYRLGPDAYASEVIPIDHFGEWSVDGQSWHRTEPEPLGDRWFRVKTPKNEKRKLLRLQTVEGR